MIGENEDDEKDALDGVVEWVNDGGDTVPTTPTGDAFEKELEEEEEETDLDADFLLRRLPALFNEKC